MVFPAADPDHSVSVPPEWVNVEPEHIFEAHEAVYDSPDPASRVRVESVEDLEEMPMFNDKDEEVPIYDVNGVRIPRRTAHSPDDRWPCVGVLQDLTKMQSLFADRTHLPYYNEFDDDLDSDHGYGAGVDDEDLVQDAYQEAARRFRSDDVPHTGYPHCFIPNMGQWQARGFIQPLAKIVRGIERDLRDTPGAGPCIVPVSSQCYNTLAHRVRTSARAHLAQTGPMTGVVTGSWARTQKNEQYARRVLESAHQRLPHVRLSDQITSASPTFLRLENVFAFHPHRMNPDIFDDPDGFYDHVMSPLIDACAHGHVLSAIKKASICLRPRVSSLT